MGWEENVVDEEEQQVSANEEEDVTSAMNLNLMISYIVCPSTVLCYAELCSHTVMCKVYYPACVLC